MLSRGLIAQLTVIVCALGASIGFAAETKDLWPPRAIGAAEIPLPDSIVRADVVVRGKITKLEEKSIETSPHPGAKDKVAYRVAVIKVEETLRGDKSAKEIRLGFVPPTSYKTGKAGVPEPYVYPAETRTFKPNDEGLFILKKHYEEPFFVNFSLFKSFVPAGAREFDKDLELSRQLAEILAKPAAALKVDNAANRYLAAAMLVELYRGSQLKDERQEKPIDPEVSKLLLKTLADADWKFDVGRLGGAYPPHPYRLFQRLDVTRADGYDPPAGETVKAFEATQKWLRDNAEKYVVKRRVPADPSK
jgi:hypothetical protein